MSTAASIEGPTGSSIRGVSENPSCVSVAEGYRRWAASYDSTPNPLLACEERHLLTLLPDIRNKRVLDLACGTGRWLARLAVRGAAIGLGIDCSTAMLEVARRKPVLAERLVGGTCEALPFRSSTFDLVICSFALEHMRDLDAIARELARITNSRAEIFITGLHPESCGWGWRVGFREGGVALQIETVLRSIDELMGPFIANGFASKTCKSLCLGPPEYSMFVQAGRAASFAEACRVPAVLVCHFRKEL